MTVPRSYASILIVEDEVIVAIDIAQTLEGFGYRVKGTFPSGEEALEFLKKTRVDIVLMDIHLRGMLDGIETASEIMRTYRIPVIYLTTYSDTETIDRAKLTEPYGYITKSFDHHDLHTTIEMALYRNKMENRLRENESLLSTTLRSINDAVITTDSVGSIRYINQAAEKLLGISYAEIEGKRLDSFQIMAFSNEKKQIVIPFYEEQPVPNNGEYQDRFIIINARKREIPIECRISPLIGDNGAINGYVFVFNDISELLDGEEISSRLISIVESSEDAIIGVTIDGKIISWNKGAEQIFGYAEGEIIGKNISILVPPFYPNEIPGILDGLKNGNTYDHYEALRQTKNGDEIIVSMKISAIISPPDGSIRMVSIIARNITIRKKLEKELLEIEDRERNRIGQDIHDSLGQQLTGISLKLKVVENQIAKCNIPDLCVDLKEVSALVKDAIHDTRKIAKGLIPVTLTSESLGAAILELVSQYDQTGAITILPRIDEDISLEDPVIAVQLYHIAQEALTNAFKYSRARTVEISLLKEVSELILSITDNGCGFDLQKTGGLGLPIMQYRANMAGGNLSILSEKGRGTSIVCRVPMKAFQSI